MKLPFMKLFGFLTVLQKSVKESLKGIDIVDDHIMPLPIRNRCAPPPPPYMTFYVILYLFNAQE
jgi:hypothetical protein